MKNEDRFPAFPKIARLHREVLVTEKIDGTNALVHVSDDGQVVRAGSRSRWIAPGDDNFGFAAWVHANAEELKRLGPGHHYGEWWGKGIQRGYGLTEKRFSLFNVTRWGDPAERPACCSVVPLLSVGLGMVSLADAGVALLQREGSRAAPGFMTPEGVVVFHAASGHLYKVMLEKDESPKGQNES